MLNLLEEFDKTTDIVIIASNCNDGYPEDIITMLAKKGNPDFIEVTPILAKENNAE